ncbi:MAG TPA: STAS/SEC14 domain-containing protein [Chthoniobacteraceae bacterium]|nr:STAS/SEC14 domain-containing protein [Chthoniobacteraceae bacterium]
MNELNGGKLLEVEVSGKLSKDDYMHFVPEFERLRNEHGKLRLMFEMKDFHGWDAGGLWEDVKFDVKHFADMDRVAMVGDRKWEENMAKFCKPFTKAEVRYFDWDHANEAREWLAAA